MPRQNPEAALHRAVAQYLTVALPKDAFWTTIPSGGGGKIRGANLKRMGLKPGVPDILIVYRGLPFFIELKSKAGRVSPEQQGVMWTLGSQKISTFVCRSMDEVVDAVRKITATQRTAA